MEAFNPVDVYPCTTDEETWHSDISMEALFGHVCSGDVFVHDQEMMALEDRRAASRAQKRSAEEAESIADGVTASQRTEGSQDLVDPDATLVDTDSDAVHRQILDGLQEGIEQSRKRQRTQQPSSTEQIENSSTSSPRCSNHILHERKVGAIKKFFRSEEAQIEVIELSDESSQMSYNEITGNTVLDETLDQTLCEEAATIAQENGSLNIMACAVVGGNTLQPPCALHSELVANAKTRERGNFLEPEVLKSNDFTLEIKRLRKLMPAADDAMCYEALTLKGGDYIKAKDLLAKWVEKRLVDMDYSNFSKNEVGVRGKAQQQPSHGTWNNDRESPDTPRIVTGEAASVELGAEHLETQISLADSEFDSQEHGVPDTIYGQERVRLNRNKIRSRKDAYKAAQGLQFKWDDFSPMSSGNAHTEEEMEL